MNSAIQMCIRVERTLNADEFYSLAFWGFIFSLRSQPTHEIDDCLELVKRIRLSFCGSWAGEFKRWDVLAEPLGLLCFDPFLVCVLGFGRFI